MLNHSGFGCKNCSWISSVLSCGAVELITAEYLVLRLMPNVVFSFVRIEILICITYTF